MRVRDMIALNPVPIPAIVSPPTGFRDVHDSSDNLSTVTATRRCCFSLASRGGRDYYPVHRRSKHYKS